MRRVLTIGALLLTSACATTYGEIGGLMNDGVTADRLTADTYRIRSRGNELTDPVLVHDYAMLRAAETVRLACATHFIIEADQDATTVEEEHTPASETRRVEKVKDEDGKTREVVHIDRTEESFSTSIRPGADFYIRTFTLAPGSDVPEEAVSAEEVITFVGARVKRRRGAVPPSPVCPGEQLAAAPG